jgi:hypothetical protein
MSCYFAPSPLSLLLYVSQNNTIQLTCHREYTNYRISEAIYIRRLFLSKLLYVYSLNTILQLKYRNCLLRLLPNSPFL